MEKRGELWSKFDISHKRKIYLSMYNVTATYNLTYQNKTFYFSFFYLFYSVSCSAFARPEIFLFLALFAFNMPIFPHNTLQSLTTTVKLDKFSFYLTRRTE